MPITSLSNLKGYSGLLQAVCYFCTFIHFCDESCESGDVPTLKSNEVIKTRVVRQVVNTAQYPGNYIHIGWFCSTKFTSTANVARADRFVSFIEQDRRKGLDVRRVGGCAQIEVQAKTNEFALLSFGAIRGKQKKNYKL